MEHLTLTYADLILWKEISVEKECNKYVIYIVTVSRIIPKELPTDVQRQINPP